MLKRLLTPMNFPTIDYSKLLLAPAIASLVWSMRYMKVQNATKHELIQCLEQLVCKTYDDQYPTNTLHLPGAVEVAYRALVEKKNSYLEDQQEEEDAVSFLAVEKSYALLDELYAVRKKWDLLAFQEVVADSLINDWYLQAQSLNDTTWYHTTVQKIDSVMAVVE